MADPVVGAVLADANEVVGAVETVAEDVEKMLPPEIAAKLKAAMVGVDGIVKFVAAHEKQIEALAAVGEALIAGKPLMAVLPALLGVVL